jgi:hypothetical protein
MSSDFERLLRQARETLPGPDEAATRRARRRALAAVQGRRRFSGAGRFTVTLAAAFLVAVGLGVGIGALIAPTGGAARGPVGLGFLPESGWNVLQTATAATPGRPAQAVAANVRPSPRDYGAVLPYATLLGLPRDGVVIVASFTLAHEHPYDAMLYPKRNLPLRLRDAKPTGFGAQVRPERPLGHYQLRATVNQHTVDLNFYFGRLRPTPALITAAQRQLDRLVVRPVRSTTQVARRALPLRSPAGVARSTAQAQVIDRTLRCSVLNREVEVRAHAGFRDGGIWQNLAFAIVRTGFVTSRAMVLNDALAWVSAGRTAHETNLENEGAALSAQYYGTLAENRGACRPVARRVPLTAKGLQGGPVGILADQFDCPAPRRVLVRLRAVRQSPAPFFRDRHLLKTRGDLAAGSLAVRTESGRPIAFATVSESGKARLFTARSCIKE